MNTTCQICGGALPNGEQPGGHTALCAGVVGEQLGIAVAALHLIAGTHGTALRQINSLVTPSPKERHEPDLTQGK